MWSGKVATRVQLQCLCSGSLDSNQTSELVGQLPRVASSHAGSETAAALPSYHCTQWPSATPFIALAGGHPLSGKAGGQGHGDGQARAGPVWRGGLGQRGCTQRQAEVASMCAVPLAGAAPLPWGAAAATITLTSLPAAPLTGAHHDTVLVLHQRVGCEGAGILHENTGMASEGRSSQSKVEQASAWASSSDAQAACMHIAQRQ